jgi:hypothetical protein
MKLNGSFVVCCAVALGVSCLPVHAQDPDRDRRYQDQDRRYDDRDDEHRHFTDHDRHVLNDWYRDHADRFEPGRDEERWNNEDLERRLQPGASMDDDLRRWARPVQGELAERLDPLPRDWQFVRIGYNVVIVDRDSRIRDVYHFDEFNDQDRRVIQDWNRDHQSAVNGFLGNFGVRVENGDLDRRLQVGAIVDQDLRDHARPAPEDLVERLSQPPREWHYVVIGDRLCLVDRDWRVHESFHFQH